MICGDSSNKFQKKLMILTGSSSVYLSINAVRCDDQFFSLLVSIEGKSRVDELKETLN